MQRPLLYRQDNQPAHQPGRRCRRSAWRPERRADLRECPAGRASHRAMMISKISVMRRSCIGLVLPMIAMFACATPPTPPVTCPEQRSAELAIVDGSETGSGSDGEPDNGYQHPQGTELQ